VIIMYKYSVKVGEKDAGAQVHDVNASPKDFANICKAIKGKKADKAFTLLEGAIEKTRAIRYTKFNKGCGHRSELGGKPGRYPKKEAVIVKKLLINAIANAANKGLDESELYVKSARSWKQNEFQRYRRYWVGSATLGYGKRAVWANYITSRVEIVVSSVKPPEAKPERTRRKRKKRY